jgi:hypothetical protein
LYAKQIVILLLQIITIIVKQITLQVVLDHGNMLLEQQLKWSVILHQQHVCYIMVLQDNVLQEVIMIWPLIVY